MSDVARANLVAADSDITGPVNIGTGREIPVPDMLTTLVRVSDRGRGVDPEMAPARPGEVPRSCLDVTRGRNELRWQPEVGLGDGLRRILAGL